MGPPAPSAASPGPWRRRCAATGASAPTWPSGPAPLTPGRASTACGDDPRRGLARPGPRCGGVPEAEGGGPLLPGGVFRLLLWPGDAFPPRGGSPPPPPHPSPEGAPFGGRPQAPSPSQGGQGRPPLPQPLLPKPHPLPPSTYPTAAFAAVGTPEKVAHSSDLGIPYGDTKGRSVRRGAMRGLPPPPPGLPGPPHPGRP